MNRLALRTNLYNLLVKMDSRKYPQNEDVPNHQSQDLRNFTPQRRQGVVLGNIRGNKNSLGERKCYGIQTNTYILTFNKAKIPLEVKSWYCLGKTISNFIIYPHTHEVQWMLKIKSPQGVGAAENVRCGPKDPNHIEEDSPNETKYPTCPKNHSAFWLVWFLCLMAYQPL